MYIMVCHTSCILAGAFILASIGTCFLVDKKELGSPYLKMLSPEKKKKYLNIVKERRNIYLQGFGIGFVVALLALVAMNNSKQLKMTKLSNICTVLAISFTINYFYYTLYPKSDYMVRYLDSRDEREAWLKIYRSMQFSYHASFALRLVGMLFIGNAFC